MYNNNTIPFVPLLFLLFLLLPRLLCVRFTWAVFSVVFVGVGFRFALVRSLAVFRLRCCECKCCDHINQNDGTNFHLCRVSLALSHSLGCIIFRELSLGGVVCLSPVRRKSLIEDVANWTHLRTFR